jgi:Tol biopolymer transport system component
VVFGTVVWTPDSRSILIEQDDPFGGGSGRIRQVPIDGSPSRTIAREEAESFTLAPDGKKIAFTTPDEGIGIVELDDLARKTIPEGADFVEWSPRSDKLAYVINDYANELVYNLFVVDADGSHKRLVSKSGDPVTDFDWRPAPERPQARAR